MRPQLLLLSLALSCRLWAQSAEDWKSKAEQCEGQQDWKVAEQAWRHARDGFAANKQWLAQATAAFRLGRLLFSLKRPEEALPMLEESRQLFTTLKNAQGLALSELQLGYLWSERKDFARAEAHLRAALQALPEAPETARHGDVLRAIAELQDIAHRWPEASTSYRLLYEHQRRMQAPPEELGHTLTTLASVYQMQNRFESGIRCYQEAIELLQPLGEHLDPLSRLARLHLGQGNHQEALELYERLNKESPPKFAYACNRAFCLQKLGQKEAALAAYRQIEADFPQEPQLPSLRGQLIGLLYELGRNSEARQRLDAQFADQPVARANILEGLGLFQEAEDVLRQSNLPNALGLLLLRRGKVVEARGVFQGALQESPDDASLLCNLAETYLVQSQSSLALEPLKKAAEILRRKGGEPFRLATVLNNLAAAHHQMGQWEENLRLLREAEGLADAFSKPDPLQGTLANSLGYAYVQLGRLSDGINFYQKSLALRRSQRDRRGEAITLSNMGAALKMMGRPKSALIAFQDAQKICQELQDPSLMAPLENNLAQLESDPQVARAHLLSALKHLGADDQGLERGIALANLARLPDSEAQQRAYADQALEIFRKSGSRQEELDLLPFYLDLGEAVQDRQLQLLEELLRGLPSSLARSFVAQHQKGLELGLQATWKNSGPSALLENEEKIRALGVLALTQGVNLNNQSLPNSLVQRIASLEERLAELLRCPPTRSLRVDLERLKSEYGLACEEAERIHLSQGQLRQANSARLPQLLSTLAREEALVEYVRLPDKWMALLIQKGQLEAIDLGPRQPLEAAIRRARSRLSPQVAASSLQADLEKASQYLWNPVGARIDPSIKRLVFVPTGPLFSLPMATLPWKGQPLIAQWELESSSSATAWLLSRTSKTQGQGYLGAALGNFEPRWRKGLLPLPGTLAELSALVAQLPSLVSLNGPDMTVDSLRKLSQGKRLLHFATHGLLDSQQPLVGGLVASDRMLSVSDVFQLKLDAQLAVLSACDTGNTWEASQGQEYIGLTRAFQHAGARTLVVTLWSVADQPTADWMGYFYPEIARGTRLSAAVQAATVKTRQKHPHPYYWAPCVLWGDGSQPL
jgi:CHAT domain-containing protein/Flp pilus assembly protein TadD